MKTINAYNIVKYNKIQKLCDLYTIQDVYMLRIFFHPCEGLMLQINKKLNSTFNHKMGKINM